MNEDYKVNVMKLTADGSNWVTYRDRLKFTLDLHGWSDHLTETAVTQTYMDAGDVGGVKPQARWKADEAAVRQIIVTSVPDGVFNRIKSGADAKTVWEDLKKIFEGRTRNLLIDLGRKLQNTRCGDDDDVRVHFESLANFREQLAAMGQSISDEEYVNTLMGSLPASYDPNISMITTNADMNASAITPATVIRIITDEYDKRTLRKSKSKTSQDEAFAADAQKIKRKKKSDVECFNCHKKGHMKSDCWAKGGGKEGQWPKKKGNAKDSAATAAEKTQDIEAWAAIEEAEESPASTTEESVNSITVETELYDSGASSHMSPFQDKFVTYQVIPPRPIMSADKRVFYAKGVGDLRINVPNGDVLTPVVLKNTLHAPQIGLTVVSIGKIAQAGYSVSFDNNQCKIRNGRDKVIGNIPATMGGLYKVEHALMAGAALEQVNIHTLHRRLGHVSFDTIRSLVNTNAVTGLHIIDEGKPFFCSSCEYAKATRKIIRSERTAPQAPAFGDEIHSDVWGPSPLESKGGRKYYISFTDDHSRYTHLALLRSKDEALGAYKTFATWAQTQHGTRIKRFRSDRGGEYTGAEFTKFLQEQGTERRLTTHDTPQHNGVAESLNRRLLERVRAMMHSADDLPKNLWGEAVSHAVWLKNRTSTRILGKVTPFECLYGEKPNLGGVPEWGQRIWVHDNTGSKLDAQANEARWVGFDKDSTHAHRVYWPGKNSVSVERDIKFVPITVSIFTPPPGNVTSTTPVSTTQKSATAPPSIPVHPPSTLPPTVPPETCDSPSSDEDELEEEEEEEEVEKTVIPVDTPSSSKPMRKSGRVLKPSDYKKRLAAGEGITGETYDSLNCLHTDLDEVIATAVQEADGDPRSLDEAQARPDWPQWKAAMDLELATLKKAGTWKTVPRPPNKNVVGSKWVYRIKRKADGSIQKYKARLVARGFTQVYGVDYFDTFSPVAKLTSFRAILALAARYDWEVESFDFNGAYLNGELDKNEEIYMQSPPGYNVPGKNTVKQLRKSLYRLKQAGRRWYDTLSRALADLGFRVTEADPGVFKACILNHTLILAIHVDDCILTGVSKKLIEVYKEKINSRYALTDLGPVHWLLGINIVRDRKKRTVTLSQHAYINSILKKFSLAGAKPYATPIVPGASYSQNDSPTSPAEEVRMKNTPYREAIGSLMYAAVATRPDISYAVSTLSQFLENPGDAHWEAVKRIFRYLAGTSNLELTYGDERNDLNGYTDADGASQEHRRAISGYVFTIDGGAISWSSRKQELVTLSTAESEYVAATHAAKEAIWLRRLIFELFPPLKMETTLYCDNQATLTLAKIDNYHARTKHIDIRYHFIRQVVASGALKLVYCPTDDMTADILTKALPKWKVNYHLLSLGLHRSCWGVSDVLPSARGSCSVADAVDFLSSPRRCDCVVSHAYEEGSDVLSPTRGSYSAVGDTDSLSSLRGHGEEGVHPTAGVRSSSGAHRACGGVLDVLPPACGISTVAGAADYPPLKCRRGKAAVRAARAVTGSCTTGYRAYHGDARGSTSGGPD